MKQLIKKSSLVLTLTLNLFSIQASAFKDSKMLNTQSAYAWFKAQLANEQLVAKLQTINLLIFDIDGSLTNGTMEYQADKEGTRYFSILDGYGIKEAMNTGLTIAFLSGKNCASGKKRAQALGIPDHLCILGSGDKRPDVQALLTQLNNAPHNTIIYGDDILDARVKQHIPDIIFACPSNSPFYIQALSDIALPLGGGEHACRLLLDLILYVQNKHAMQDIITNLVR